MENTETNTIDDIEYFKNSIAKCFVIPKKYLTETNEMSQTSRIPKYFSGISDLKQQQNILIENLLNKLIEENPEDNNLKTIGEEWKMKNII